MVKFSSIVLFCSLLYGCTTTVPIRSPLELNRRLQNSSAEIISKSGSIYNGISVQATNDSINFIRKDDSCRASIRTQDVASVKITHHLPGALEGLMFGGLGGLGVGLVLGIPMASESDSDMRMGRGLLGIGGLFIGGTGGFVIGLVSGHSYNYVIQKDSISTERK
jgi:hypothetical protein